MIRNALIASGAVLALLLSDGAKAHPHVWVEAKSEVIFGSDGRIGSIRQVWRFDPAFSSYAIQGLDIDGDGVLSEEELKPLARVNVESLAEFDFFTFLTIDDTDIIFMTPEEYWLEFDGSQLTLFYDLPLREPVAVGRDTRLEVFDPEYFVAFNYVADNPVSIQNAPDGCAAVYHPPQELDSSIMAMLGALPQEQRELPPELAGAAAELANSATISCP